MKHFLCTLFQFEDHQSQVVDGMDALPCENWYILITRRPSPKYQHIAKSPLNIQTMHRDYQQLLVVRRVWKAAVEYWRKP